ncbi:unnamed protein product, partial [Rotaria magnacalcarata]
MAMHIIWPQNLALIATLRTLHERKSSTADTDFASSGLDLGVNIELIIIYTALLNNNIQFPDWWGNNKGPTWKNCSVPYSLP